MTRRALPLSGAGATAFPLATAATDLIAVARLSPCAAAPGAIAPVDHGEHRLPFRLVLPAAGAGAAMWASRGMAAATLRTGVVIVGALLVVDLARAAVLGVGVVRHALLVIACAGSGDSHRALPCAPYLAHGSLLEVLP